MNSPEQPAASRKSRPGWGAICMLASLLFFSTNSLLLKFLSSDAGISPWVTLLFRAIVGLLVILLFFTKSGTVDFRRAATGRLLVYRGVFGVLGSVAYYFTVPVLGAGKATLISNTYVVMAAVLAAWYLKERLTLAKLMGNVVACCGLILLLGLTPQEMLQVSGYEILAVFGAVMAAGTVVVIRQLTLTESSAMIYTSQCIYILLGALPPAVYYWSPLTNSQFMLLVFAAACATFGQLAMTEGFRHLTVAVGGAFQIMAPVLIAIGGILLFNESFTQIQVLGAGLILAGCYGAMAFR